ncbi:prepilin-type N-terminal cleavage/methylation domain-containing protein, partial [Klebsiella pneumoniae]|nr:prepilin-type N-terminal cleavage/methylation domain-containing protein [Klebsiella pneumoniae]
MNTMTFASRQRGASLLEVLIAVLVLAIGMLGMAALQAVTIKNSNSASARSLGVIQVYS